MKSAIAPPTDQKLTKSKFDLPLKEIEFTIPNDYDHETQLKSFGLKVKRLKTTYRYNTGLIDQNFFKVSHKLVPGKTYIVKFIPVKSRATHDECLDEYRRHNAVMVGAQGITLLQETHPGEFLVRKCSVSFDTKDNLPCLESHHVVPHVYLHSDGDWQFCLVSFGYGWNSNDVLVVFCEKDTCVFHT